MLERHQNIAPGTSPGSTARVHRDSCRATPTQVRAGLRELDWGTGRRYVEMLRERGDLASVGDLDFDLSLLFGRHFECDSRTCVEWEGEQAVKNNSCCSRYRVVLTRLDRERLKAILPLVQQRLPEGHLLKEVTKPPTYWDDDYHCVMEEDDREVCPFIFYEDRRCRCWVHQTCLEEGLDPFEHKPLACSLWPVATLDYRGKGGIRTLVTVYRPETIELFEEEDGELDECDCIMHTSAEPPTIYDVHRSLLWHLFGQEVVETLDEVARTRPGGGGNGSSGS